MIHRITRPADNRNLVARKSGKDKQESLLGMTRRKVEEAAEQYPSALLFAGFTFGAVVGRLVKRKS